MARTLTDDELVIVYHALIFTLHTTFSHSPQPTFDELDFQSLAAAAQRLNAFLQRSSADSEAELETATGPADPRLIGQVIRCVRAFDAEIGHSPAEIKIITNRPASVLKSLLSRLTD